MMQPAFYTSQLVEQQGGELLFAHRWLLLCFKREFPDRCVLRIWEACWAASMAARLAQQLTPHFHLFVALTIVALYCQVL